ncbi:MAG: hypothetical protein QF500_04445 [Candidatus Thalassarchaeaceae archaeon]|nr:hypothetical protein [Candidatus Thalassarchaeaceae archaeon]
MEIEWVQVTKGRTELGSQNRSILFGGIGPRHMVAIDYNFQISRNPISKEDAESLLISEEIELASESEWHLAFDNGLIEGSDEIELLADRSRGDYWGKYVDGRSMLADDWVMMISKKWNSGSAITHLIPSGAIEPDFVRLVRRESQSFSESQRLPLIRDTTKIIREEVVIAIVLGIIPSFLWAHFNATPGYIETGWPGLVLGGAVLGLLTGLFWRPKTTSYRIGRNCGKVKANK